MRESDQVAWGMLGAAGVARRRFLPALRSAANARLVVAASRRLERAEALVAAVGQGRAVDSYDEVLKDQSVEAVYIPLPNALHHYWTRRSLEAGKHVLCEKPLALSVADAEDLAEAARSAGRVVMEGFMYRLHPQYEPARWRTLLGRLGAMRTMHVRLSFPFNRPGDIRENPALGGGALWDIGCYCLDLLCWQLGSPLEVQAMGEVRGGCNWTTAVQLRFGGGVVGSCWWSFAGPLDQRLTLIGEHGTLELDSPFRATGPATGHLEVDGRPEVLSLPSDDCFRREIEHFGAVVRGTARPAIPLSDSARWLAVAEKVDAQVRSSGRPERDEAAAPRARVGG
jgi:D-xylose 1-dehydrogenase (NADP+, D-xylono-1,5-lactone-forming)